MNLEYPDLVDYIAIARRAHRTRRRDHRRAAESAPRRLPLHASQAGFGDEEFYPEFVDKAAVLVARLTRNHPLPDGNKRAAWVTLRLFIDLNGWSWDPMPSVDDAERAMLAIAAGEWDHAQVAAWLREHLAPSTDP